MNKYLFFGLLLIAGLLIGYNATKINWEQPLQGDSLIAVICTLAAACAALILLVYRSSKKIEQKLEDD